VNKSFLVIFVITALITFSCKDKPNTSIEGVFRNSEKNSLKLEYLDINKTQLIDSIGIKKNGDFKLKVFIDQPGLYILKNDNGKIINLLISPGEKIKIDGDYQEFDKNYSVVGSPESEYVRQLVEKLTDTRNQINDLDETYKNITALTGDEINNYMLRRNEILKEQRDYSSSFLIDHLSSLASIYTLYQKLTPEELVLGENKDIQYMKIVADTLSVKYPGSVFVQTFVNDARKAEKRYTNMIGLQKKMMDANTGLPDVSFPDPNGTTRSLSSLKGKTVLLYFWTATSELSKQQSPVLEKIYRKYKNKGFEIFAVCVDEDPENGLKLIQFDEQSFINTFGPEFLKTDDAYIFNLRQVPANYLLDKEGNIIARDLYGAELEKWLDNKL